MHNFNLDGTPFEWERKHIWNAALRDVLPCGGTRFIGQDFRDLCGPQVYLFLKDGMPLYIGMSGNGIERCGGVRHQQAKRARNECDEVLIYPCRDKGSARRLEGLLIGRMGPKYNVQRARKELAELMGISRVGSLTVFRKAE